LSAEIGVAERNGVKPFGREKLNRNGMREDGAPSEA